jgi:hypothetical protein
LMIGCLAINNSGLHHGEQQAVQHLHHTSHCCNRSAA